MSQVTLPKTQSSPVDRVALEITSKDKATELSVLDGGLREVARGRSTLNVELMPGIFKVVARTGGTSYEQLIVLDKEKKQVRIPQLKYASPLPLRGAGSRWDQDCEAAVELCGRDPVKIGDSPSSSIYLFIRESATGAAPADKPPLPALAYGLTLCDAAGKKIIDIGDGTEPREDSKSRWARTISLQSGFYRLRVALPGGESIEQSIFAAKGWQTQIFIRRRTFAGGPESLRPDLSDATILSRPLPNAKFEPDDPETRLADLARIALGQRRQVLCDTVFQQIIPGNFRDPILAISAAHLLLLAHPPKDGRLDDLNAYLGRLLPGKEAPFATFINRLRGCFPSERHPDVEALALLLGEKVRRPYAFLNPPMFRQSWARAVEASARNPQIIPAGSVSNAIALRIVNQGVWLLWRNPSKDAPEQREQLLEEYRNAMQDALPRSAALPPPPTTRGFKVYRDGDAVPTSKPRAKADSAPQSDDQSMGLQRRQQLVQNLGIPASNVEQLVNEIREQKSDSVEHYPAVIRLEIQQGASGAPTTFRPRPGESVQLQPGQQFKLHIRSRRSGFITVALLGPEHGTVIPRDRQQIAARSGKPTEVDTPLQGPKKEKTYLLVLVTARPAADRLRTELKDELKRFPDHAALMNRLDRLVKASGQDWVTVGAATLSPDLRER